MAAMLCRLHSPIFLTAFIVSLILFYIILCQQRLLNDFSDHITLSNPLTVPPGSVIIYNRIPKTGSTTLTNSIAYDLCETNGFHVIHLNMTRNRYIISPSDQGAFVRNVSKWSAAVPAVYHGHVAFIDFAKFGYRNPIYINMVREPFERFLSYYYFLRYGDDFRVGLKRRKAGNNETFDECLSRDGKDCDPKLLWLQIPYFCGTASFCSEVGSDRALEMAKQNLINHYLVVGLTERMDDTITALEELLPSFFNGAREHFKELNENRSHLRHTQKKYPPTAQTIHRIKANHIYQMEREFYDFAVHEFNSVYTRLFDAESRRILRKQFRYEKIKPEI